MRRLNKKFMHKEGTTDVLSFPQVAVKIANAGKPRFFNGQLLGDIVISLDQASRQARAQNLPLRKEVAFLIVHSLLHLVGYDHDTQKNREKMQERESRLLFKIPC